MAAFAVGRKARSTDPLHSNRAQFWRMLPANPVAFSFSDARRVAASSRGSFRQDRGESETHGSRTRYGNRVRAPHSGPPASIAGADPANDRQSRHHFRGAR